MPGSAGRRSSSSRWAGPAPPGRGRAPSPALTPTASPPRPRSTPRPEKFFEALAGAGATVRRTVPFADHHRYSESDAASLLARAAADGLRLVTTEKDMARLAGATGRLAELREKSSAFGVTLEFENPGAVGEMLEAVALKAR